MGKVNSVGYLYSKKVIIVFLLFDMSREFSPKEPTREHHASDISNYSTNQANILFLYQNSVCLSSMYFEPLKTTQ